MIQVFFTLHNVTIYSFIHAPQKFCIPHCIAILSHHLEFISLQSSSPVASLGPWGTILCGTKPFAACCSLGRFPMDTSNGNGDHMQVCMAIVQQHRPNLGRFDACHLSHLNVPNTSRATCHDVTTACVLCIALQHWRDHSLLHRRRTR